MLRIIVLCCAMLGAPFAFAQGGVDQPTPENRSQCSYYNGNPAGCANLWFCKYDQWSNRCEAWGGNPNPDRQCWAYDRDPQTCNQQFNCRYNHWTSRCEDTGSGGGNPNPGQCYRYSHDPRTCENAPGCYWDTWSRTCRDQDGGGGGGQTVTTVVECGSHNYGYRACPVWGQVVNATLYRQLSSAACIDGRTWGRSHDGVWVDRGCRAQFRVTYYRN